MSGEVIVTQVTVKMPLNNYISQKYYLYTVDFDIHTNMKYRNSKISPWLPACLRRKVKVILD